MTNIIEVNYAQTGESKKTNSFGIRDVQAKCLEVTASDMPLLRF